MRVFNWAAILVVLSVFLVPWASAADLSADYLHGRWVIDEQSCSSPDSEYIVFSKNGTFEGTRTGQAEIVGFWGLKEGILNLHMVTSPAFFTDLHKDDELNKLAAGGYITPEEYKAKKKAILDSM